MGQLVHGELPSPVPIEADDTIWGDVGAPVTIVVFLDVQCPFCARAHETLKTLQQIYGKQRLRVVFKHLPLDFHRDALVAALALQAVRELGGHRLALRYTDRLLASQHQLSEPNLVTWAEELGIARGEFQSRLADPRLLAAIDNDIALATKFRINGTPTFLVNGAQLVGAQPASVFQRLIDSELTQVSKLRDHGIVQQETYALRVLENLEHAAEPAEDSAIYRVPVADSPVLGPSDALVTIVEFSEFQCPFCQRVRPTLEKLRQQFPKDVRLVFKHLPLGFHDQALPAARLAAELQRVRGNQVFWQAAAELFDGSLEQDRLLRLGRQLGLSEAQARAAVLGDAGQRRVEIDLNLAEDLQAKGTPHFFINGRRLAGARPYAEFERMVLKALVDAKQALNAGVLPKNYYDHLMQQADPLGAPREVSVPIPSRNRPSWGPSEAPVVVHAFSDFECSYCARVEPTLAKLRDAYPEQLRVVWHNLPLPFHRRARPAARAALEAHAQRGNDGFHQMHALLFSGHRTSQGPQLAEADLIRYADKAALDVARFRSAMSDGRHDAAIEADLELARTLGVEGTPGFVVGRWLTLGARPFRYFKALVERTLEEQ